MIFCRFHAIFLQFKHVPQCGAVSHYPMENRSVHTVCTSHIIQWKIWSLQYLIEAARGVPSRYLGAGQCRLLRTIKVQLLALTSQWPWGLLVAGSNPTALDQVYPGTVHVLGVSRARGGYSHMGVPMGGTGSSPRAWRLRVRTPHAWIRFTQGQCMFWGFREPEGGTATWRSLWGAQAVALGAAGRGFESDCPGTGLPRDSACFGAWESQRGTPPHGGPSGGLQLKYQPPSLSRL